MVLIHPRFSRMVPKLPPQQRGCFLTITLASKCIFWCWLFHKFEKAIGTETENRTCFSICIFMSNVLRGVKIETISYFLSHRFLIQGLVLKKIDFLIAPHEKKFKINLKLLEKCSKKCSKVQNIFFIQNASDSS